jgi:unsaturated rhamnogalacturonyl hydrolase
MRKRWAVGCILGMGLLAASAFAADAVDIGLSTSGARIQGMIVEGPAPNGLTVALIGGIAGGDASVERVRGAARNFEKLGPTQRAFRLLAIPLANPDGTALEFPPTGVAYRENPEANALWRWLGVHAPDLVLIVGEQDFGLANALAQNTVAGVGSIPAQVEPIRRQLLDVEPRTLRRSEAHREMDRRLTRTPRQLADELAEVYGHDFEQPLYIQALALVAQARLGHVYDVKTLVEPYVNGTKNGLERPSSLVLAGHIVFTELARKLKDPRYVAMVRKAADLGFDADGQMKESMPYHDEYSDSVFMGTVIAAQAGALTGERKYFDLAARHVAFMQKLVLRPDGLYRHTPLTEAAWGRGNGFPAIGLALTLSEFPKNHPAFESLLHDFQAHMAALAKYQDRDGLWRNVIDYPGAYGEFTATAMIGFAMLRGVRSGWLPAAQYRAIVDKAWRAVLARVGSEGRVVDACESTTKLKTVEEYLHRAAILGRDPRAGAMALLFATEMAGLNYK